MRRAARAHLPVRARGLFQPMCSWCRSAYNKTCLWKCPQLLIVSLTSKWKSGKSAVMTGHPLVEIGDGAKPLPFPRMLGFFMPASSREGRCKGNVHKRNGAGPSFKVWARHTARRLKLISCIRCQTRFQGLTFNVKGGGQGGPPHTAKAADQH